MSTNNFRKITFLILTVLLAAASTVYAQPGKKENRGVTNKPTNVSSTQTQQSTQKPETAPQSPKKKTIVVLDFNDKSLTADSVKRPIGNQLSSLLTAEFAKRGSYTVVSQLDKEKAIEKLRKTTHEGKKDKSYAAKIGQELSANLVVFGDLIEYTVTSGSSSISNIMQEKHEAKVGFTLTLVDVNTSEVKDGVTVEHIASSKNTSLPFFTKNKVLTEDQRISMLTEASKVGVCKAANSLVKLIDTNSANPEVNLIECEKKKDGGGFFGGLLGGGSKKEDKNKKQEKTPPPNYTETNTSSNSNTPNNASSETAPRIAAIDGQTVFVRNLPKNVKVGTKLIAYSIGKVTTDKKTGEILFKEEIKIAELEIVSITDKAFICRIVSGSGLTEETLVKLAN